MLKTFLFISLFAFICINPNLLYAQGVTTAAMNGLVQDADGNPLPGANIIAEHMPSGTQYGASTRENGLFNLPNLLSSKKHIKHLKTGKYKPGSWFELQT